MPRDPRFFSEVRIWQDEALSRYRALNDESRQLLLEQSQALSGREDRIEEFLHALAQADRALTSVLNEHFSWNSLVELREALYANEMFHRALEVLDGNAQKWLTKAAQAHVYEMPEQNWFYVRGSQKENGGLEPIGVASTPSLMAFWQNMHLEGVTFVSDVALAIYVLETLDHANFIRFCLTVRHPAALKVIADGRSEDPDFGLALAASALPLVAALGVHHHLAFLEKLEVYGELCVRELDPVAYTDEELEKALTHRTAAEVEIKASLVTLVENIHAGPKHDQLLGELLARGRSWGRSRGVVFRELRPVVAEAVSRRLETAPDAEFRVWHGVNHYGNGFEALEAAAHHLESQPESATRWRHVLKDHFAALLEVTEKSETSPLYLPSIALQDDFTSNVASALRHLALSKEIHLGTWFQEHFKKLPPRSNRPYDRMWDKRSPRAALLMLVGGKLMQLLDDQPEKGALARLLRRKLAQYLPLWEWEGRFAYLVFDTRDNSPLELRVLTAFGELLPDEELRQLVVSSASALTVSCLARPSLVADAQEVLDAHLEADLLLIKKPLLGHLILRFTNLNLWEPLDRAMARFSLLANYRGWQGLEGPYSNPSWVDVCEALRLFHTGEEALGIRMLETICRLGESGRASPGVYLNALRNLEAIRQGGPGRRERVARLERYLSLNALY